MKGEYRLVRQFAISFAVLTGWDWIPCTANFIFSWLSSFTLWMVSAKIADWESLTITMFSRFSTDLGLFIVVIWISKEVRQRFFYLRSAVALVPIFQPSLFSIRLLVNLSMFHVPIPVHITRYS